VPNIEVQAGTLVVSAPAYPKFPLIRQVELRWWCAWLPTAPMLVLQRM